MSDLSAITDELSKYAESLGIDLTTFLTDGKYAEQLKLALLDSKVIPSDLKKLIMAGLASSTQQAISSILNGTNLEQIGYDDNTKEVLNQVLGKIANDNNVSLEELLKDDKYANIIREALTSISKDGKSAGTKDDPTKNLESILKKELGSVSRSVLEPGAELLFTDDEGYPKQLSDISKNGVIVDGQQITPDKLYFGDQNGTLTPLSNLNADSKATSLLYQDPDGNFVEIGGVETGAVIADPNSNKTLIDSNTTTTNALAMYFKQYASKNNIGTVEDLVGNKNVSNVAKTFNNFSTFSGNITKFSDSSMVSVLKSLVLGK